MLLRNQTYKFRAELPSDAAKFLNKFIQFYPPNIQSFKLIKIGLPDVECEISTDITIDKIKKLMSTIVDGHVMVETIQPINNYTGDRI